jgi:hypothetical protein
LPERHPCGSKTDPQAVTPGDNSHVSNILPLTTFRTIDLGGKEFSDPLFSRFCAEMRVFFEENPAPEYVQKSQTPGLEVTRASSQRSEDCGSLVVVSNE